ncbi:hypothetical protein Rhe02_37710 [Rhizocola hellebori]|uniref:DUF2637 domain-containing protein n=1 Tax=Rhizocola hellebori TaxID=1392758 RepID=A0A8J3Q932_9ACTN|nr:hypothetical protein [Rhizocola hellebori]GIH05704.1 hypothetical protein Rhe02_37710 [Rhizocola hellebori]
MLAPPLRTPLGVSGEPTMRYAGVERAAWCFYAIAALGSSIGQIWVGVEVPPWPDTVPVWVRAVLVLPFAIVIDLGGAVSAGMADWRQRLGESAYGWRILSAASVVVGVGINVVGHASVAYLAVVFGGLGCFAYAVWLLHSAARRRDALRAAGKLRNTAPAYGLLQWRREPAVTARARSLALEHGYGVVESLTTARAQIAEEVRRTALAGHIDAEIRAQHADPILAAIAATTTPVEEVAQHLMHIIDTRGWARRIAAKIQPPTHLAIDPPPPAEESRANHNDEPDLDRLTDLRTDLVNIVPTKPADYRRWHTLWITIRERPEVTNKDLAKDNDISVRTVQRIRAVGAAGLLDAPAPTNTRHLRPAASNGHRPRDQAMTADPVPGSD